MYITAIHIIIIISYELLVGSQTAKFTPSQGRQVLLASYGLNYPYVSYVTILLIVHQGFIAHKNLLTALYAFSSFPSAYFGIYKDRDRWFYSSFLECFLLELI